MKEFTLHTGKMEVILPNIPDNTFHSCVTDPPYALNFMGKQWDASVPSRNQWEQVYRVLVPGAWLLSFGGPRTYHRMVCEIEDAGFEIRDQIFWVFGSGFPKSHNLSDEFEGWGTALKPAHEPIVVARKPLIGSVKQNMEQYGTGALNIKDCRVEGGERPLREVSELNDNVDYQGNSLSGRLDGTLKTSKAVGTTGKGRWPANLIHDGSEEVMALFPEAPGQMAPVGPEHGDKPSVNTYGDYGARNTFEPRQELDKSAARFFYCAKTSRLDRNEGCEDLPDQCGGMLSENSGQHLTRREVDYNPAPVKNNHPTVKPTDLMRYLCRLVTPKGGLIIDPFCGSGSTGKAAMYEHMRFVGIDMDQHNIDIGDRRIKFALKNRDKQMNLFDGG